MTKTKNKNRDTITIIAIILLLALLLGCITITSTETKPSDNALNEWFTGLQLQNILKPEGGDNTPKITPSPPPHPEIDCLEICTSLGFNYGHYSEINWNCDAFYYPCCCKNTPEETPSPEPTPTPTLPPVKCEDVYNTATCSDWATTEGKPHYGMATSTDNCLATGDTLCNSFGEWVTLFDYSGFNASNPCCCIWKCSNE